MKRLPFANKFRTFNITDPYQVYEAFDYAIENPDEVDGIIIDTLTFLMDMYESQYVLGSANMMAGWSNFQQYFKKLMQEYVPKFGKTVIITAHTRADLNEATMTMETSVPIKGALKGVGVEAYFSTVVAAKVLPLKSLSGYESDMLNITEDDEFTGQKYVFQTRHTKETTGERIRSPIGFFTFKEAFIDNCAQQLLDHLTKMYN